MTGWSILAGVLGLLGTGVATAYLSTRSSARREAICWFLGIAALLPAWLVAFLDLLGRATGPRPEKFLTAAWILSSSAGLLGVIATDTLLKRLRESGRGRRPATYWLLGVVALLPAWGIALLGLLVGAGRIHR
jgi:hypothetical protein